MPTVEKVSIALPHEMVVKVREAVEAGEYASNSEVVRDALRDWQQKRELRELGISELRAAWTEALKDKRPGVPAEEVLDRLKEKLRSRQAKQGIGK